MKHMYKMLLVILLVANLVQPVQAKSEPQLKVYDTKDLTYEILSHRKGKEVIVERIVGKVINKKGDGRISNPRHPKYNYISYRKVKGAKKGKTIVTYCIYNPHNNYEDDIMLRLDFVL